MAEDRGRDESPGRIIAHVDMDSFFTAVEVRDNPDLRGRPVIVGADPQQGRGRGVVSAASYEARKYGVHSAMPISQAYRLCPGGVFLPGRMSRYAEVSDQVMEVLSGFTPLLEQVSVDEAFLDLSGCRRLFGDPPAMGIRIKAAVTKQTGLTASVGIGPNKLVAKIASDLHKPDGLVVVKPDQVAKFMENLPLRRLWGVGPKTEAELLKFGIRTIGELAALAPEPLVRRFGESGRWLHERANGIDRDPVCFGHEEKSLGRETTFERDTDDCGRLQQTLLALCDEVAARLRQRGLQCRTLTLKIRYQGFETHAFGATVPAATDETMAIYERAKALLNERITPGRKVRLLGVTVSNLGDPPCQADLFDQSAVRRKQRNVDSAIDEIKARYGRRAVIRAGILERAKQQKTTRSHD